MTHRDALRKACELLLGGIGAVCEQVDAQERRLCALEARHRQPEPVQAVIDVPYREVPADRMAGLEFD